MMISEILQDEFELIRSMAKNKSLYRSLESRQYYIFPNNNPVAFYFIGSLLSKCPKRSLGISIVADEHDDFFCQFQTWSNQNEKCKLYTTYPLDCLYDININKEDIHSTVLFFTPTTPHPNIDTPLVEEKLKYSLHLSKITKSNFLLFSLILEPCSLDLPECVIAEKEFELLFSKATQNCPGKMLLYLEKLCWQYQSQIDIRVIRCDGVFGPGISNDGVLGIYDTIHKLSKTNTMDLPLTDRQALVNASYIRDVVLGLLYVLIKGSPGEVYHVSNDSISKFIIKTLLLEIAKKEDILLSVDSPQAQESVGMRKILRLSSNKLRALGWKPNVCMKEALQKTYQAVSGQTWDPSILSNHQGKLKRIQELELCLLKEVDRICKKHNIQYFLVCGSALGAI